MRAALGLLVVGTVARACKVVMPQEEALAEELAAREVRRGRLAAWCMDQVGDVDLVAVAAGDGRKTLSFSFPPV